MSPFLSFFPNFYLLLALPLVNLFFNHLSSLWKNGDNFMSRCIIIQMHLCTFWTGQECISMHSQNKAHLLDNPQRTVSTAAWRGHALVFQKNFAAPCCVSRHWAHLPQMLRCSDHHAFYWNNRHSQLAEAQKKLHKYNAGGDTGHRIKKNYTGTFPSASFSLQHQHGTIKYK